MPRPTRRRPSAGTRGWGSPAFISPTTWRWKQRACSISHRPSRTARRTRPAASCVLSAPSSAAAGRSTEAFILAADRQTAYCKLWRTLPLAREGKWPAARAGFKDIDNALAMLPIELQRVVLMEAFHAAIETRDAASASKFSEELQGIGIPPRCSPTPTCLLAVTTNSSVASRRRWRNTARRLRR